MQTWLSWAEQIALTIATSALVVAAAARFVPELFVGILLRRVDQRNSENLERIKADLAHRNTAHTERLRGEISATYATLQSSVDFIAASQRELREKIIKATEELWAILLRLKNGFGHVNFLESVLLPNEIDKCFTSGNWGPLFSPTKNYAREEFVHERWVEAGSENAETYRLFVSERLWLLFFVFRAFNARIAHLYFESFKQKRYVDWRKDTAIHSLLKGVLDQKIIDEATASKFQGMHRINSHLEAAFIKEGLSLMSGLRTLSDTIGEIGSTLLGEKEKLQGTLE